MDRLSQNQRSVQEQLSALADGELDSTELGALLDALERDPAHYAAWTGLHAGAAATRGEPVSGASGDLAFWQSIRGKIASESILQVQPMPPVGVQGAAMRSAPPANATFWKARRFASIALVLAVGGVASLLWPSAGTGPSDMSAAPAGPALAAATTDAGVMLRDPQLDALMEAHQQMGGHSAWQGPSGFLRNATYERPSR